MGNFGGYYKGDKKKQKKEKDIKNVGVGSVPILTMPELISKKKKDY